MWRLYRKKATQVWFHVMCPAFLRKKMCFVTNTSWADTWMIIRSSHFFASYRAIPVLHVPGTSHFGTVFGLVQKRSQNAIDQRHLWDRHLLPAPQDGPAGADDASDLVAAYFGAFHQLESWRNRRVFVGRQKKETMCGSYIPFLEKPVDFAVSAPISLISTNRACWIGNNPGTWAEFQWLKARQG